MKTKFSLLIIFMISPVFAKETHYCDIYLNEKQKMTYQVEIAQTLQQKEVGLMYRNHLDKDKGMLFPFKPEQKIYMWMKNTLIPLDMLFIDKQNQIVYFYENALPNDTTAISSKYPISNVLEINAGEIQKQGLKTGMKISCY